LFQGEEATFELLEDICNPTSAAGSWMRRLDLTPDRFRVRNHAEIGQCNRECKAFGKLCSLIIEPMTAELAAMLSQERKISAGAMADKLCDSVCKSVCVCRGVFWSLIWD
jgi:hypothetical protein